MSEKDNGPVTAPKSNGDRDVLLRTLWNLTATSIANALSQGDASAATLSAARAFLADNAVNAESLRRIGYHGIAPALAADLPEFKDDPADAPR